MVQKNNPEGLPPYAPYTAWRQLMDRLRTNVPDRIDNSYLAQLKFNQATRSMLLSALRFLRLVDNQDHPNGALRDLVNSEGEPHREMLWTLVTGSYAPVLSNVRLEKATPDQLRERFKQLGARGDVARKCASFFAAMAEDAGMELSPHIRRRRRQSRSSSSPNRGPRIRTASRQKKAALKEGDTVSTVPRDAPLSFKASLLSKIPDYPSFDPSWDPDIMRRWFEGYSHVVEVVSQDTEPGTEKPPKEEGNASH